MAVQPEHQEPSMGLFDFLKRSRQPEPTPPAATAPANRRFHADRSRMFDLERTGQLHQLFAVPRDRRDAAWYARFWDTAWCASVALADPKTFIGPDAFHYLRLNIPQPGPFDSQSLANVASDCLNSGVGAAFFASPDDPPEGAQYVQRSEFAAGSSIDDMARALTWYLPPGRSIVLMPEDWNLASMTPLRRLC
jgi:hypothetical protein